MINILNLRQDVMKNYLIYNPLAGNGKSIDTINVLINKKYSDTVFCDITEINDLNSFVSSLNAEDKIIICGGDGTLNNFINSVNTDNLPNKILFLPTGSGNDFIHDLGYDSLTEPLEIGEYIKNLPILSVNGKSYKFINGIGYGIDGYVCYEGNRLRKLKGKSINYTLIALKGLIYAFKPVNATVTVDGKEYKYKKVWLAPSMKGKFFGGGMKIAPMQDRSNEKGSLSVIVAHDLSKLKITALFGTIFKGGHIKFKKNVTIHTGNDIHVVFDRPCPMQIDGETLNEVYEYSVKASSLVTV